MISFFLGYIPKRQHYFANTYGEVCRNALTQHETERQDSKQKQAQLKHVFALQSGNVRPTTDEDKSVSASRLVDIMVKYIGIGVGGIGLITGPVK